MRNQNLARASFLAIIVTALAASVVQADVMYDLGEGYNSAVTIYAPGHLANGLTSTAGQMHVRYKGLDLMGYCVDIDHYYATTQVTEKSVLSLPHADMVAYLFDKYAGGVNSNTRASALQASIWEVINETSTNYNVLTGNFAISNNADVATLANSYLTGLPTSYTPHSPNLVVLDSADAQDIVVQTPEPVTLALLAVGGLTLLCKRRNRASFIGR